MGRWRGSRRRGYGAPNSSPFLWGGGGEAAGGADRNPIIRARDRRADIGAPDPTLRAGQPPLPYGPAGDRGHPDRRDISVAGADSTHLPRGLSRRLPGELHAL